jgi:hypothetical protein
MHIATRLHWVQGMGVASKCCALRLCVLTLVPQLRGQCRQEAHVMHDITRYALSEGSCRDCTVRTVGHLCTFLFVLDMKGRQAKAPSLPAIKYAKACAQ